MWHFVSMAWTKWTDELIRDAAKQCHNMRDFHSRYRGAEKAAKRIGILDSLFPDKEIHATPYTLDQLKSEAANHTKRSKFQLANPSMYNAAMRRGIIKELFPVQLNRRYSDLELIEIMRRYKTITEFDRAANGAYQIACRRGLVEKYGPPAQQGSSTREIEVLEFLQSIMPDFRSKRFGNDYELDCYSETLKLGVEYNGLYWHSETQKSRRYHLDKTKYFEERGIRVIHIWEHEWRNRCIQVKNYLLSACKVNSIRVGARKCVFKEIESSIAKKFLAGNHIQGAPHIIQLALGIYYKEVLISVATFGEHHRKRDQAETILNRFACLPGVTVQGGLAKVSCMASEKLGVPLKSWADYSKSQANGYVAAGWVIEGVLPVDYFYGTSKGEYVSKQSRKKSIVKTPQGMTESQHAKLDGLHRIWDCGKIVLSYKYSSHSEKSTASCGTKKWRAY